MEEVKLKHPLTRLREHISISQYKFADTLIPSATREHICLIESGKRGMGRTMTLRIVDAHRDAMKEAGITVEDLLRGFDPKPKHWVRKIRKY